MERVPVQAKGTQVVLSPISGEVWNQIVGLLGSMMVLLFMGMMIAGIMRTLLGGHHSPWLTPEQRRELVEEYGTAAVRWAEEVTTPGDFEGARRAARFWYGKLKEIIGA